MAEGNQCRAVRLFGGEWDYQCPGVPALPLKSPTVPAAAVKTSRTTPAEEGQSCRYVRTGGDYFEICQPKASCAGGASGSRPSAPAPSIWSTLGEWLLKALSSPPPPRAMFRR